MFKPATVVAYAALLLLAGCEAAPPTLTLPGFKLQETRFTYTLPQGYCPASDTWKASFTAIADQNSDKLILLQLVDCVENARYANSPNYIIVMTFRDPARMKLDREGLLRGFKPVLEDKAFAELLRSGKSYSEVERAAKVLPGQPLGPEGNQFPAAKDDRCIFTGGRYGQPPLTPETSGTVINCDSSIAGYQVLIMHNGDGKQDLLEMARRVNKLAQSIRVAGE